ISAGVCEERVDSSRGVVRAAGVRVQRIGSVRCIPASGSIAFERIRPARSIETAGGVVEERRVTHGRITSAAHCEIARVVTKEGVADAEVVKERYAPLRHIARAWRAT